MTGTRELGAKIKADADAEAARAEIDPDTGEVLDPNEPTPEPTTEDDGETEEAETPPAPSGPTPEQMQKTMDRALTAFHDKLCKLFEVDELQPSSTPGVLGFVLPGYMERQTHENFTRCATCNGYGKVLTGSLKAGDDERDCPDPRCKGRGYWERGLPAAQPQPQTLVPLPGQANGDPEWPEAPAWMGDPRVGAAPPVPTT